MMISIGQVNDENHVRAWIADRKFAPTSLGDIAYIDRGTGDVALFLHGFPLNSFQWRDVIDRLSEERRCIALDFLSLGHTKVAPGQSVTFSDQVNAIAAFLDCLKVPSVDLIANDSGTAIAQLFAVRFPERIRTMLLTNGDVETDCPPPRMVPLIQMAKEGRFADEVLVPSLQDKTFTRSANGIGALTYTNPTNLTDAAIDYYFGPLVGSDERKRLIDAYTGAFSPNPLEGLESKLCRCDVPTRIVWGMSDLFFSVDSPEYLNRILPNSRGVREIPEAKLFFPEEYPDVIAEEARNLWAT